MSHEEISIKNQELKDHIKITKKKRALISQNSPMSINEESAINKICIDSNNQKA